jgi:hypothetical protein
MYLIYRITSPSGKSYIGLTKGTLRERWRQHVKKAGASPINHPFYNAIRKYGKETFTVEQIDTAENKQAAQKLEMYHIALHAKELLYNLSPGGEADGEAGSAVFWGKMTNDPVAREAYCRKLSSLKKANDWTDYDKLLAGAATWRRGNPKEAHRIARRASRVAARIAVGPPKEDTRPLKERLMWKHNRSAKTRYHAKALWARRTAEEVADVAKKIGDKNRQRWAGIEDKERRSELTRVARASIDRSKQGPAASAGIKRFWQELKNDPVRYADYMRVRTESLHKKLREKALR